jgi:DNA-binding IscR family transcriptional regulator
VHLARRAKGEFVPVLAVATAQNIPPKFLEQILLALKIIRLFDGALAPTESVSKYFYEPTPIRQEKHLLRVFKDIRDYVSNTLERTTLEDVS